MWSNCYRSRRRRRAWTLHSRVAPETPSLLCGDGGRLRQVLTNLSATPSSSPRREVKLESGTRKPSGLHDGKAGGKAALRFAISDTGIGLRPGQAAYLFSPFVQADASTTRKYGGTGLGLAICKHLVEMMGGTIGVNNREGQGSTFWFTAVFDTASPSQPAASTRGSLSADSSARATDLSEAARGEALAEPTARILVAEDNATNKHVALAQLRKLGYQASVVSNGAEAVEAVQQGSYDLVLMDCQMPVMDGFEAHRRIRLIHPNLAVIAVTADAMPADQERCLREGMNDYLAKPVNIHRLADVLAKWLPRPAPVG